MKTCTLDCDGPYYAKGMCQRHYATFRRTGQTTPIPRPYKHSRKIITIADCIGPYVCAGCNQLKSSADFPNLRPGKCNTCHALRARLRRYGITEELLSKSEACEICNILFESVKDMHIDHDHSCCPGGANAKTCGKCTRGILCTRCNSMLGFAKDNPDTLLAAVVYLSRGVVT